MPFRSEAQKRKFAELLKKGEISQETYNEWHSGTKGKLPERVGKKPVATKAAKVRNVRTARVIK